MRALARMLQSYFPVLQDARFEGERWLRRRLHAVHDRDWRAFGNLRIADGEVLDIGANRGQSIDSFRVMWPDVRIISFEPNARLAARLQAEFAGDPHVRIEAVGLSDRAGLMMLYLPRYRRLVFDGLASLDRDEAMNWLNADRISGYDPALLQCLEMLVEVRTLDSFGLAPSVIKLDIQGAEEVVLRGGMHTIERTHPAILLEGATPAIADLLEPLGYAPHVFDGNKLLSGRLDSNNVFFLTAAHRGETLQ